MRIPGYDLNGAKAVLEHLQISRSTFRRMAKRETDPLPVGFVGAQMVASREELDAWALRQVRRKAQTEGRATRERS